MKVLRTEFINIKLYNENLIIDFIATDKVVNTDDVYKESLTINRQNVISIAGINATGKSLSLRLIDFAFNLLEDNTVLKYEKVDYSLFKENSEIIIDFLFNGVIYRLISIIGLQENNNDLISIDKKLIYKNEFIYKKNIASVKKKTDIFAWKDKQVVFERQSMNHDELSLLNDNHSFIIKIIKNTKLNSMSFIDDTNVNALNQGLNYNNTFVNLFDNSIEKIEYKQKENINIKFKNDNYKYEITNIAEQFRLLSSGTIKGAILLNYISTILVIGGYVIIDEIEAHLNKTLVEFLIELFLNNKTNPKGATLIFTTHYSEVLDSINRKDAIYVSTKDKNNNLHLEKFSSVIKRNDVKKSEILLSNYFGNTAPSYEAIQNVKKIICERMN